MHEISFDSVKKYMDATLVLRNISFQINEGEKVGIIGENGSGKTTILKLIAGILKLNHCAGYPYAPVPPGYDEGWVKVSKGTTCAYLEQITKYAENMKVIDVLNLSFTEVHRIEAKMHELESDMLNLDGIELKRALSKYSELMQLYEIKGGYDIEEKLSKICKGLKFDENFLNQDFNQLSGGEKTTVILGKLLIDKADVLLLDEPTNHLDMDSVEWLQGYIKSYKGIVIVVSHDRYFLDQVAAKIIEVEDKECETYTGNYTEYFNQKEENLRIQLNIFQEQKKKINKMEQSIKELRDWANRADNNKFYRRAASIQKKLDKMKRIDKPIIAKQNMRLNLKMTERSGNETIKAVRLCKSYGEKVIFSKADLLINYGERVALIGPNGSGKTTFIKLLLKEESTDAGTAEIGANVNMAYLPQNISFENEEITVLEYFRDDISITEGKAREYLSKFMFFGSTVFKKIRHLSGGERIRLKLSKLLYEDVNLLILDEPTNHLDIESIETLEEALEDFKGTIFFISHDRYFINKISERVIAIEDKGFKTYLGNYDYYRSKKDEASLNTIVEPAANKEKNKKSSKVDESRKREAEAAKLEARIADLECKIRETDESILAAESDYMELNRLFCLKEKLTEELESVMNLWLGFNENNGSILRN